MRVPYILHVLIITLSFTAGCQSETKQEEVSVSASQDNNTDQKTSWIGSWHRTEWQNDGALEIKAIKGDTLTFSLFASNGGHLGDVEGFAVIKANIATYTLKEDDEDCLITFERYGDSLIKVEQVKGNCYTGMGVHYTGDYYNANYKKLDPEEELKNVVVLDNADEDAMLRKITGNDYELFANTTQLTSEDTDIDSLQCRVYTSGVRGLFTLMENIVMVNNNREMWAAVIDDEKVHYYTNRADYADRLPKRIEEWRKRFIAYPVTYKNSQDSTR